jgi:DeoR/GlpR family transcriptional regulator of sugar metabolism
VGNLHQVSAVVTDCDPGKAWQEYLDDQRIHLIHPSKG